jgi:hypothetical protein
MRTRVAVSPIIPTVAVFLLAVLWASSVFAGWGLEAFCADGQSLAGCQAEVESAATVSGVIAAVAMCFTALAWVQPSARRFMPLMIASITTWVLAEAVLFAGGLLAG